MTHFENILKAQGSLCMRARRSFIFATTVCVAPQLRTSPHDLSLDENCKQFGDSGVAALLVDSMMKLADVPEAQEAAAWAISKLCSTGSTVTKALI